ncbi:MAG TPA: aminopeptidase P N-terminal domain-containing protein [bacterium]|nr:aminopeptidase P N-terminal domain-containing protein [bacterium]
MKNTRLLFFILLAYCTNAATQTVAGVDPQEYRARRQQLLTAMDSSEVLVVRAAASVARAGDVNYPYHQDEDFYYLTGCREPGVVLLLVPAGFAVEGQTVHELLFAPPSRTNAYTGITPGPDKLRGELGIEAALPDSRFQSLFGQILEGKHLLYLAGLSPSFINDPIAGKGYFLDRDSKKVLKDKYPGLQIKSAASLIMPLRLIKSAGEVALMQKAIDATDAALREAIKSCEPGLYEYELQAVIEYGFLRGGCAAAAFSSIIGSGPNSVILHYDTNERRMEAGETVVMDVGGEYAGYCADVTRTIPVGGRFTAEQKTIYNLVLAAHDSAIAMIRPGATIADLNKKAAAVIGSGLIRLGLMKAGEEVAKFLPHGISHQLGLEAHDVEGNGPLAPGMVITIEPGIYIGAAMTGVPAAYRTIGIRIEDDVLVTPDGRRVLSNAPRSIVEIEKLMKKKGIANHPIG